MKTVELCTRERLVHQREALGYSHLPDFIYASKNYSQNSLKIVEHSRANNVVQENLSILRNTRLLGELAENCRVTRELTVQYRQTFRYSHLPDFL